MLCIKFVKIDDAKWMCMRVSIEISVDEHTFVNIRISIYIYSLKWGVSFYFEQSNIDEVLEKKR